jgi:hypothetical protein
MLAAVQCPFSHNETAEPLPYQTIQSSHLCLTSALISRYHSVLISEYHKELLGQGATDSDGSGRLEPWWQRHKLRTRPLILQPLHTQLRRGRCRNRHAPRRRNAAASKPTFNSYDVCAKKVYDIGLAPGQAGYVAYLAQCSGGCSPSQAGPRQCSGSGN